MPESSVQRLEQRPLTSRSFPPSWGLSTLQKWLIALLAASGILSQNLPPYGVSFG